MVPLCARDRGTPFPLWETHAVHYADAGIVSTVLVDQAGTDQPLKALVELVIESPDQKIYTTHAEHMHSPPPRIEQAWHVEPRLPDAMDHIRFLLVPGEDKHRWDPQRVTLSKPLPLA